MDADVLSAQRHPARLLTITGWLACTFAACLLILALAGAGPTAAQAAGNASAAAGFIESAQNKDGGFGEKRGTRQARRRVYGPPLLCSPPARTRAMSI